MKKPSAYKSLPINPRYGVPALSWSDVIAIEQSPKKWLDGRHKIDNDATRYGIHVHKLIEKGHIDILRLGNPETKLQALVPISPTSKRTFMAVGRCDDSDDTTILDYKTGQKLWTQKQVLEHGQLHAYAFMRWRMTGKRPTRGIIVSLETAVDEDAGTYLTGKTRTIEVPITLLDCIKIQHRFQKAYAAVTAILP